MDNLDFNKEDEEQEVDFESPFDSMTSESIKKYGLSTRKLSCEEIKVVRADLASHEFRTDAKKRYYAYAMLLILLSIQISN